jgi:HEAT repeat protein
MGVHLFNSSMHSALLMLSLTAFSVAQQTPQSTPQTETTPVTASPAEQNQSKPRRPPQVTAWRLLRSAAADHSATKRQNAILALSTLGSSPGAVRLVEHALIDDKDDDIRQTAASALAEMKARSALPLLRKALDDKSEIVRFTAARALWDMGDRSGRDVLIEVLQGESSPSKGFLESSFDEADKKLHNPHALALMGINEASGAFLGPFSMGVVLAKRLAKDKSAGARALSAALLASDHDPRSVRDLDVALGDKTWAVREAAAKAIGNYRCKCLIDDLAPLLDDKKEEVRLMAAASILRISAARPSTIPSECTLVGPAAAERAAMRTSTETPPPAHKP